MIPESFIKFNSTTLEPILNKQTGYTKYLKTGYDRSEWQYYIPDAVILYKLIFHHPRFD